MGSVRAWRGSRACPGPRRRAEDVNWVRGRMEARGSIEYARQVAHALAGAAQEECARLYAGLPDSSDRRFIEALPLWVLERR